MKRILIIITTRFVEFGGLTSVMMNYYREIDKTKYSIDFASTNCEVSDTLKIELSQNNSKYYCLGNRKKNTIVYFFRLASLIKKNKYDVIHINSNSATAILELFTAYILGIKNRIVHNHTEKCDHKYIHSVLYPVFRLLYTQAISCSKKAGDWIFKDGKYTLLNNGINTSKYRFDKNKRDMIRKLYSIEETCTVLGHVGKLYKPKNHFFLLDIFYNYHNLHNNSLLLIVGDGEMRCDIEEKVKEYGIIDSVIFAGMRNDSEAYLSAMDYFVFPSLWEGMPLALIEAQASGITCFASNRIDVACNVTGKVEMLDIESGSGKWVELIDNIVKCDRDVESSENINILIDRGYDTKVNIAKLEELYNY